MKHFERNIDPRTAMDIGGIRNPLTICEAEYLENYHGDQSHWAELDHHNIMSFLNFLDRQKDGVSLSDAGWRAGAFVRFHVIDEEAGESREEVPFSELMGKCVRIEFEEKIYRIPSHIKI